MIVGHGKHAAIEIPDKNLSELGANKRAPLKVTVNRHTYQSTATGVGGKCMVVFPSRDRLASGVDAGDKITVTLVLDNGYRKVDLPVSLNNALVDANLTEIFRNLIYSKRKEYARQINDAKSDETKNRRVQKIIEQLKHQAKQ